MLPGIGIKDRVSYVRGIQRKEEVTAQKRRREEKAAGERSRRRPQEGGMKREPREEGLAQGVVSEWLPRHATYIATVGLAKDGGH